MDTARRLVSAATVVIAVVFCILGIVVPADASPACIAAGGNQVGGECQITTAITAPCPFTLSLVNEDLRITSTGSISCDAPASPTTASASDITITVQGGDMIMEKGSRISAEDNTDGGNGGKITITVSGDMTLEGDGLTGAVISASKNAGAGDTGTAGAIRITVGNVQVDPATDNITCDTNPSGNFALQSGAKLLANAPGKAGSIKVFAGKNALIDGLVSSVGGPSAVGQGGPITIDACCDLIVTGTVISKGADPGADLVHLQGCVVKIFGLVASTGPGHFLQQAASNLCKPSNRPGKPANSTACVEIWSGTTILIDATGPLNKGEVNADVGLSGDPFGRSWIDILAHGDITINGNQTALANNTNANTSPPFAVHANQIAGGGLGTGGVITVITDNGKVTTSGRALQANGGTGGATGGLGGEVHVEAGGAGTPGGDVNFGSAFIQAMGDTLGGGAAGGIISARSANGHVVGVAPGQLNASGDGAAAPGSITLQGCNATPPAVNYTGGSIPPFVTLPPSCGVAPVFPSPANVQLPDEACAVLCQGGPEKFKSGTKFNDLNKDGNRDLGEPGLQGWVIHIFGTTAAGQPFHEHVQTDANGFYKITLTDGTYTACEDLQPGWTQSAPNATSPKPANDGNACETHPPFTAGNTVGANGYTFTISDAHPQDTDDDFGNFLEVVCQKFPNLVANTVVFLNPNNPTQIQQAIDNASQGDVILLMPLLARKTESIIINKNIQLFGCSIQLAAADPNAPVVTITTGANGGLTKDVHATGSMVAGYKVEASNHSVLNVRAFGNAIGFWVTGNSNLISGAQGTINNGIGVKLDGNSNVFDSANAIENSTTDGVVVTGTGNTVKKSTVRGSGGNGFKVDATALNTVLSENKAYANALNGYLVLGANTTLSKNIAGDIGNGNSGDGIRVDANGGPLTQNTSRSNGLVGIRVTGTGHTLTANKSGGTTTQNNGSCQYVVGPSNTSGGSNTTSNNTTFTFTAAGAKAPAACVPATPIP